jgi:hypothetical protein
VLAKRAVVKGLQTGQEDIDQVVVQPIVLMRDKGNEMQIPFPLGASGQLKDLGFDDAIGIVLNAVLAEGEMIQHGFEQSIAGFNQLQIGDPFFHFRRFGRLRQLLHQGQFVGLIAPRRRLVGVFLPQQGIEQRPGAGRQQLLDRVGQAAIQEGIVSQIQYVITLVIGEMPLEQLQSTIDLLGQS